MTFEDILYDTRDAIATITLNRPDKLNAWTRRMEFDVRNALAAATEDDGVRVIIMTGAGRGYCAGADMDLLSGISNKSGAAASFETNVGAMENGLDLPDDFSRRNTFYPTVPKPIIAAINGPCAGLGMVLSLYADMRFAAESAIFTTAFAQRGLIAEHGVSWMLPKLVGHAVALDLLLSARKVTAAEALSIGLVNGVFPDASFMDDVRAYANRLANLVSPRSMRVMKEQVYNAAFLDLGEATAAADKEMVKSFDSEDFREGVAHYVEKRPPVFTGR